MSFGDDDIDDYVPSCHSDSDDKQLLSKMFFEAKSKGISEDSYADWQAIVAKECESDDGRNFSFKASKRIFRIELARGDYAEAKAAFERLVSFIPDVEPRAVRKAFLSRKPAKENKNLLHIVCPKLNRVPYWRQRSAIEKSDEEIPFILHIYQTLSDATKEMRSTLLHVFKACSLRLAKLFCCIGKVDSAIDILVCPSGLLSLLRDHSGEDLGINAVELIELYAFLASMHCDLENWRELKSVIERVTVIECLADGHDGNFSFGTDTDNIALIRACDGILHSKNHLWNKAFVRFHQSFSLFCESHHDRRHDLLMICVIVGCLTDAHSHESQMAVEMEDMPEVKGIIQANDTVKSVIHFCNCFRSNDLHATEAALQGAVQHFISSQFFLPSIVDRILMPMRSKVYHLADPYFDHLISRLVYVRRVREWSESAYTDAHDCITANCRFILQAESFSLKSAHACMRQKQMCQVLPFPTPLPFPPVLCSEVSHASVLRRVRCGQDSLIACLLASKVGVLASPRCVGSPRKISRWVQDINARVHRHHRGQMLKTLVGLKQTVVHNGFAYKSFAANDPDCQQLVRGNVYPVDLPWELCHQNTRVERCLCSRYYAAKYRFERSGYECIHYKHFGGLRSNIYGLDAEAFYTVNQARIPPSGHGDAGYGWEPLKDVSQLRGRTDILLRRRLPG
jgi:hypothetical protein